MRWHHSVATKRTVQTDEWHQQVAELRVENEFLLQKVKSDYARNDRLPEKCVSTARSKAEDSDSSDDGPSLPCRQKSAVI